MSREIKVGTILIAKDYFHMNDSGVIFAAKGKEYPVISVIGRTLYITDENGDLHGFDNDNFEESSFRKWFTVKGEPTPSHSEETEITENTGKHTPTIEASGNAIHYIGKSECFAICPVRNGDHDEADNRANLIVTAVNSYATLKAENVMLLATIRSLNDETDEAEKQINNLQSDNEAKEKRIQELERNYTEAVASIENLNDCLDKMWNDRQRGAKSEIHRQEITKAQQISKEPRDKWYADTILNPTP